MAEAIRLKHPQESVKAKARRSKVEGLKTKTFAELSAAEKDELLELVAERLGLIRSE
jgi:hypothetical protein